MVSICVAAALFGGGMIIGGFWIALKWGERTCGIVLDFGTELYLFITFCAVGGRFIPRPRGVPGGKVEEWGKLNDLARWGTTLGWVFVTIKFFHLEPIIAGILRIFGQ